MAATSTKTSSSTKPPATGAGLAPIWIRLPRLEVEAGVDEIDADATAPSLASVASPERETSSHRASNGGRSAPAPKYGAAVEEAEELPHEAPAYLHQVADRRRSADVEDEDEELPRTRRERRRARERTGSFGLGMLLRPPYNVLAGVVLVASFVGLYACFRPPSATEEAAPEIDPGLSLSLDLGDPAPGPYAHAVEPVDPATLYPETTLDPAGSFEPAPDVSGVASADYGAGPNSGFEPVTTQPPSAPGIGMARSVPAANASTTSTASVDPALDGLPLETYPETDPATYRYPADATFDVSPSGERTAEGDSRAPRAATLGDSLEKTPVR